VDEVTRIDVPELIRIGDAATEVGTSLAEAAGEIEGWAFAAREAAPGASMCFPAMSNAATGWQATLASLAGQIQDFGRGLHRSADDYRRADAGAAQRVRASGHPGPDRRAPR
jgi:hypothetical protein